MWIRQKLLKKKSQYEAVRRESSVYYEGYTKCQHCYSLHLLLNKMAIALTRSCEISLFG